MLLQIAHHIVDLVTATHGTDRAAPAEWLQRIPAHRCSGRDGRGPHTVDAPAVIAATRTCHGSVDIPIDYDHQLVFGRAPDGTAPAAGWVTELEDRDGAIWGRVRWTPKASAQQPPVPLFATC